MCIVQTSCAHDIACNSAVLCPRQARYIDCASTMFKHYGLHSLQRSMHEIIVVVRRNIAKVIQTVRFTLHALLLRYLYSRMGHYMNC
jgi:hypothetical protein